MTVTIGATYTEVAIPRETTDLVFPPTVKGSIKPGTLDNLDRLQSISWGTNMTGLIEPGTIPNKPISLWLPKTYTHDLGLSQISDKVQIYVHTNYIDIVPEGSIFLVWAEDKSDIDFEDTDLDYEHSFLPSTEIKQSHIATTAMGCPCYCRWARMKVADEEIDEEPVPEPVSIPCSIDTLTFEQMLAQSRADDPRLAQAERVAVMVGMELYANLQAAMAAHTLHNEFNAVYKIGELGGRDIYRDVIINSLRTAFPSLTFTIMPDMSDRVFVTYNC